jgi:hypothetical protein
MKPAWSGPPPAADAATSSRRNSRDTKALREHFGEFGAAARQNHSICMAAGLPELNPASAHNESAIRRLLARRMSAPPPPSVTASGEVVGSDFGRHGEHPGASMSVAWMPIGRACQQLAFTVSDVRRSQRTTRNTSIKSRDTQDPVPILVTGLVR